MNKSFPVTSIICPLCNEEHSLFHCKNFNSLSSDLKLKKAKELKICINCLFSHNGKPCISTKRCRKCNGKHNSLIHDACVKAKTTPNSHEPNGKTTDHVANNLHVSPASSTEILLATALIKVVSENGSCHILRALIDQGSQVSLISENAAQRLGVKRTFCRGVIYGIGENASNSKGMINITCMSTYSDFTFSTDVLIMNNLMKRLPNNTFAKPAWSFIHNINLADPEFYVSRPVDLLLGSDIYALIKMGGISRGDDPSLPLAEQTQLGWILFGRMQSYHCNVVLNNIRDIQQFWEIENIDDSSTLSSEDQYCIDFYMATTKRRQDGRYVVKLPIKQSGEKLGFSKGMAVAQFRELERKFQKQTTLAEQYKQFMNEYRALHHMIPSTMSPSSSLKTSCFLPHHAVQRAESSTTKLRVVFNASAKTSSGYSLNDIMYKGPNLQKDLQFLILKWRLYRYGFTADIEKMYRQIMVSEDDQHYQQIVWRDTPNQPIQTYFLTTVVYGLTGAPFLAMMTLKKLAADESRRYPEAARVIEEAMYMDDLVKGCHDIETGKQLIADVNKVLKLGGFTLRKWMSNEPRLLQDLENQTSEQKLIFNFKAESTTKTLGLRWDSQKDKFTFQYNFGNFPVVHTKRTLLSEISKLFDPLGWLAPLSTKLKLLFQKVWTANLQWDDVIPNEINSEWIKIKSTISSLTQCEIPRWIGYKQGDIIQLHGFCDASVKAYAGVIYARIIRKDEVTVVLIGSKTRLVPSNKTISLPRLEICGALLLSKWMEKVKQCLGEQRVDVYGWSDSMVVLGWLQGEPGRWKTFVANRVRKITEVIEPKRWRYVKSSENPADPASRGLLANQLANSTLWWHGPGWLKSFNQHISDHVTYSTNEECSKKQVNMVQNSSEEENIILSLLHRYSSFNKIVRIVAWILRAIKTMKRNRDDCKQTQQYLTLQELKAAKLLIIKYVQQAEFQDDIEFYQKNNSWNKKSRLLTLNPFIDANGILRVGGRLKNAQIHSDMKYPIVIPHKGILTNLLIDQAHQLTYHGGPRLTLSNIRQKYWILSGNRAVKQTVGKCVKCRKHDPQLQSQLMGDLPAERVNQAAPFYHTGVDYTGYVEVKASKGRGVKTTKGYIALFICMVTKAIHLELVSDLSSTAFLAALRRMAARRGPPRHIYSDNGTNFVGANRVIQEEFYDLRRNLGEKFFNEIADLNIEWHFNAPSWPSAGGLWERAVRSLKHHLKRVIGDQKLTFEEFSTMLAQIESCLNSRPLCPLTEDVDCLDFLTPAHFLTGRVGSNIIEIEQDARSRWHLADKLAQDVWKRFKTEYLTQLSIRSKWRQQKPNLKEGDLVTIQDDNLPPGKWLMGRVIELHPGPDNLVRVVSLKTKNGVLKRPIVKLSVLPLTDVNNERTAESGTTELRSKRKAIRNNGFLSMAISFILFMSLLCSSVTSYNITKLNVSQGLYFDKIGNMKLVRDQWKLVVYYNMNPYWEGMKTIQKYQSYLEDTCAFIRKTSHCDVVISQLRHSLSEVEFTNRVLLGQQNNTRTRKRRGLVNGIGYLANTLFGVLDDRFAEQYQKDISQLRSNQQYLAQSWKNQTSVVEGEYNVLQRIEQNVNKQHKVINQRINEVNKAAIALNQEIKSIEIINDFTLMAMIANNLINNIQNVQENLVDMLTDIHHQQFNTHILSVPQFQHELNIIAGQLTKDLSLPIQHIYSEMAKIYKLIKVKARLTNNYFIFEIRIPLITRANYELYKLLPIPFKQANQFITITPISTYVAVNLQKDTYLPLKENEIQQCIDDGSLNYVCDMHPIVYNLKIDNGLCITDPTTNKCQASITACSIQWIQLSKLNQYLFVCCEQCALRFMCGDQITVEQVNETCIVYLATDCIVKEQHFTAYAHNTQLITKTHVESDVYSPQIAPINHIIKIWSNLSENETADLNIHLQIKELGDRIKQMKDARPIDDEANFYHHIHHYAISYGLVVAAGIVGAVLFWRRRRHLSRRQAPARELPAPGTPTSSISVVSARKQRRANRPPKVQCLSASVISDNKIVMTDSSTSPIPLRVHL